MNTSKAILGLGIAMVLTLAAVGCDRSRYAIRASDDYYWDDGVSNVRYTEYRIGYGKYWDNKYCDDRRWNDRRWDNRHWNDRRWDDRRRDDRHGDDHHRR
ncbi:MAG: hypothetical protein HZA50_06965 [Planctomycetes bacterium]|nr:hypothetical protein [Planctomycetota bacterium]